MGSIKKLVKASIKDANIEGNPLKDGVATTAKFGPNSVESSEIGDGVVGVSELASTLNLSSKTVTLPNTSVTAGMLSDTLDLSPKSVTLADTAVGTFDREYFNISLLGFKMATQENLTVFNLVDGIVDEFHDESGTDEAEGSNDTYCATSDFYNNSNSPSTGPVPTGCTAYSAGFAIRTVTEEDTSEAATNPAMGQGTPGTFTVPSGLTSIAVKMWGAGGGGGYYGNVGGGFTQGGRGGGGGYVAGTIAVTPGQSLLIGVAEGGTRPSQPTYNGGLHADHPDRQPQAVGTRKNNAGGAGYIADGSGGFSAPQAPSVYLVVGGGGTAGDNVPGDQDGGAGGGLTGCAGGAAGNEQTNYVQAESARHGGGGDQEQGGQSDSGCASCAGGLFYGAGKGGAGYYGGGSGGGTDPSCNSPQYAQGAGGGGSSYYGHPQVTSGSTEEGSEKDGGGQAIPGYVTNTNRGTDVNDPTSIVDAHPLAHPGPTPGGPTMGAGGYGSPNCQANYGQDGYVLMTGTSGPVAATVTSSTIISNAFAASSVPTKSRIVVFEENVDTPTLNTDIIASISRDGGSTFTNATLADSGYVTGTSGQRILTGQATISGQPSGQSMRWKLALANNIVKIHGVSLSWA